VNVCGDVFEAALVLHGGAAASHLTTSAPSQAFTHPAAASPHASTLGDHPETPPALLAQTLMDRRGGQVVTLNAEMTMAARANPELGAVIEAAELVIPDGAGVVWALGRQGFRVRRAPGIELARRLLEHAASHQWRVALVGASPEVMDTLVARLRRELPGLFHCAPYAVKREYNRPREAHGDRVPAQARRVSRRRAHVGLAGGRGVARAGWHRAI
jgi:UDP-N-acetyl-D-mannosaminuronic acid transferase (WecB/TagA/CpsF family)